MAAQRGRAWLVAMTRQLKRDPSWDLDPQLTNRALASFLGTTTSKVARGLARRPLFRSSQGLVLIGKHVTIRNPEYISVGRNFIAEDYCEIQGLSRKGLTFGERVTVGRFAMIRPSSYYGGELGEGLVVGDNSNIGPYCYVGASGFIQIGSNVLMSPRVSLFAENHNFADTARPIKEQGVTRAPITIEDDCWIASGSIILAGVTVHRGSIVAAGSVVTRDVPPYSIVAGSPARVIKMRRPTDGPAAQASAAERSMALAPEIDQS